MKFALARMIAGLLCGGLLILALVAGGRAGISTDLFELLPEQQRDPLAAQAMNQSRDAFFRDVSVVIAAPQQRRDEALAAAMALQEILRAGPLQLREAGAQSRALRESLLAHRFRLLSAADREALNENATAAFRDALLANLARPGSFDAADPAGYLDRYLAQLPAPGFEWTLLQGLPVRMHEGQLQIHLNAELTASPLDPAIQTQMSELLTAGAAAVNAQCADCTLDWTGAIRFSQATRQAAERDVMLLSSIAIAGITLLFLFGFRSLRPLLAGFAVLGAAILAGVTAGFTVFGKVHVLTLVFGTTLIGLCIDYVMHLVVHRWAHPQATATDASSAVRSGLALGLATSVTAFVFLSFAGFPALSQLAVFSSAGLVTAWLLVRYWLPAVVTPRDMANPITRLLARPPRITTTTRALLLAGLAILAIAGLPKLGVVDDVRGLQAIPADLAAADSAVRRTMQGMPGQGGGADFYLVEDDDLDSALRREREFLEHLGSDRAFGLSRYLPDASLQQANLDAWAPLFEDREALHKILLELGFRESAIAELIASYAADAGSVDATHALLASTGFAELRTLKIDGEQTTGLIVRIDSRGEMPGAFEGVRLVQPLLEVEATFGAIRHRAIIAVAAAYLLMLLMLSRRYGFIGGLRALAPALFGAVVALGLLGLAGLPLNIFSLVALILVLGIGADYALFLREGSAHFDTVRIATAMAAATSLLSFGLLVLSSLPALQAFGFATASGILAAWLAAPFALPSTKSLAPTNVVAAAGEA